MILTGSEIEDQVKAGRIIVEPFDPFRLNPNSIDISLGKTLLRYITSPIDPKSEANVVEINLPPAGLVFYPGEFLLGSSCEVIGSTHYVPLIHAKSSTARAGLFAHVTADLIDIGSIGNITFQLYFTLPLRVYPGMFIGQVTFWCPKGEILPYDGKYKDSIGPKKSKIHMDPFWETYNAKD